VLISAPQKGWSSSPCCALIALGERGRERIDSTQSTSFSMDLKKWLQIMEAYEKGGHVYHTTMPTDALKILRNVMKETQSLGFAALKAKQIELGTKSAATGNDDSRASVISILKNARNIDHHTLELFRHVI
jgi:aspartate aminotransferase-like enzyme